MGRAKYIIVFFFFLDGLLSAQTIDSVHAFSTGKVKLGMTWNELKPYVDLAPATIPNVKYFTLKSGFDKKYLTFPITDVEALVENGVVTMIQMNFGKYDDDFFIEEKLTAAFGKSTSTEGDGSLWQTVWTVGKYQISLNGGEDVSQYYLYLKYKD